MLSHIRELALQDYVVGKRHKFMINSTPNIVQKGSDVYVYGNFGYGFKGGYALKVNNLAKISLDVSNDTKFASLDKDFVHFELTPSGTFNLPGTSTTVSYGSDLVGKMNYAPSEIKQDGNVYLVYSSGFDATDSSGVSQNGLFVVDLFNKDNMCNDLALYKRPCIIKEIPLDKNYHGQYQDAISDPWNLGRKNAIGPNSIIELSPNTNKYDAIYVGDYFGNLWKLDIAGEPIASWGDTKKPKVIFNAVDSNEVAQPITGMIGAAHYDGGVYLVFGTGSFVYDIDNKEVSERYNTHQLIYAMKDMTSGFNVSSLDTIKRCTGENQNGCLRMTKMSSGKENIRTYIPAGTPDYGWYADLESYNGSNDQTGAGERVYTDPLVLGTTAYITTNIPNTKDPCVGAGVSAIFEADLTSGTFKELQKFDALAKSTTATIHNGKVVIHVPLDSVSSKNDAGGDPQSYTKELAYPGVKHSSRLHIY